MGKSTSKNPNVSQPAAGNRTQTPHAVRPRDQVQDLDDPYLPDRHLPEGTLCSQCGAVYHDQHWVFDAARRERLQARGNNHEVVCPGCRKVADHDPHGILTLHGDYWPLHRDDILNLIRHEEERGLNANPLERIMNIREETDCLVVETTNEKLAQRIGRQIDKAHKGRLEYKWSDGNRLVRVEWERSLNRK
jgi:hypothetical protein